jgi:hypothetical protein
MNTKSRTWKGGLRISASLLGKPESLPNKSFRLRFEGNIIAIKHLAIQCLANTSSILLTFLTSKSDWNNLTEYQNLSQVWLRPWLKPRATSNMAQYSFAVHYFWPEPYIGNRLPFGTNPCMSSTTNIINKLQVSGQGCRVQKTNKQMICIDTWFCRNFCLFDIWQCETIQTKWNK